MFTLRDLPSQKILQNMARRYPEIDPDAVEACLLLLRVASDLMAAGECMFARHGISTSRFMVLMILNRDPEAGLSPSQLADKGGVTRATMTGLLDSLERDGLVTREHDSEDRRGVTIRLTSEGLGFLDRMLPGHFRRISGVMADLNEQEKKDLADILNRINDGIHERIAAREDS